MQIYKAPLQDYAFLFDVFGYDEVLSFAQYASFDRETSMAIAEEASRFCVEQLLPLNRTGDQEGIHYNPEDQTLKTPKGFQELYGKYKETGFGALTQPEEYGGMGAPQMLGAIMNEIVTATNKSFSMCPGLGHGLVESLLHYGTDQQKKDYLEKLITGEWTGTMCLTEPQCGTDLGMLTTKATPEGDHFRLTGTKIWITFGEHDLTDNIIHLVLARLPDAPPGIKGISTFIVPKVTIDGRRNSIYCTGVEHKMGIHASPTCVMSMENAEGYLIGEPHRGMRTMFLMMNSARLTVGIEGLALSEISYQTALEFAKDRRQSRSLDPAKREMDQPADNILVHPDVRRMLLNVKSTNEAMRGLGVWLAREMDNLNHEDEKVRAEADDLIALLTPVVKSYMTERGFANINECMQVCGGSGFTTDWSIEQYMRDERIAMIYEGTNHIQALDLVGRKLPMKGGQLVRTFQSRITDMIRRNSDNAMLAEFITALKGSAKQLTEVTMALGAKGMEDAEEAGAAASSYLNLFALTVLTYVWCCQLETAAKRDDSFAKVKFKTARYFVNHVLPERHFFASRALAGKADMMAFGTDEL